MVPVLLSVWCVLFVIWPLPETVKGTDLDSESDCHPICDGRMTSQGEVPALLPVVGDNPLPTLAEESVGEPSHTVKGMSGNPERATSLIKAETLDEKGTCKGTCRSSRTSRIVISECVCTRPIEQWHAAVRNSVNEEAEKEERKLLANGEKCEILPIPESTSIQATPTTPPTEAPSTLEAPPTLPTIPEDMIEAMTNSVIESVENMFVEAPPTFGLGVRDSDVPGSAKETVSRGSKEVSAGQTMAVVTNYASFDCGARVIETNIEAKNPMAILQGDRDVYMLNPCSANITFVVKLCDMVSLQTLEIASSELFPSSPERIKVYSSDSYPTAVWNEIGTFVAMAPIPGMIHHFPLEDVVAEFIMVVILSHYGGGQCTLNRLRVMGVEAHKASQNMQQRGGPGNGDPEISNSDVVELQPNKEWSKGLPLIVMANLLLFSGIFFCCCSRNILSETKIQELPSYEDLTIGANIGNGAFGAVFSATYKGSPCAAKILNLLAQEIVTGGVVEAGRIQTAALESFHKESNFLVELKHDNIVRHIVTVTEPKSNLPILVMELMDCSLKKYLEDRKDEMLSMQYQCRLCLDIAEGLTYLHEKRIIHRDLCDDNVLLALQGVGMPQAKIADFGMSRILSCNDRSITLTGLAHREVYIPPEARDDPFHYSYSLDVYSLGVIAMQIVLAKVHLRKKAGDILKEIPELHSLKAVIQPCLFEERKSRPKAADIVKQIFSLTINEKPLYEDLTIGANIGNGAFGAVFSATYKGSPCAAKILNLLAQEIVTGGVVEAGRVQTAALESFHKESNFLVELKHDNIVRHIVTVTEPKSNLPILVMELMDCSLKKYLEDRKDEMLSMQYQCRLCLDIAEGLTYLHEKRIIHRDLCDDNVLLALQGVGMPQAKIADFGMSRILSCNDRSITLTGLAHREVYIPPEARDDPFHYSYSLDVYSLGVIAMQIVLGKVHLKKKAGEILEEVPGSHLLKVIIKPCLAEDRKSRPEAADIVKQLQEL